MSIYKQDCSACGHDIDTHYRDPRIGERWACTGAYCDCRGYTREIRRDTPVLPAINFGEAKTKPPPGKPHVQCTCAKCLEWEWDQISRGLGPKDWP